MGDTGLSYCGRLAKAQDPDRFLMSMLAPPETREALWALAAFNHEIAKTLSVVSEPQLGMIRLQWWRDEVARIYDSGQAAEHEVLQPLAAAIKAHDLPQAHFETLIHAREFDLGEDTPENVEGLINYADFTTTPLLRMMVSVTGGHEEMEPVQPVAVNYALAGILRAVPYHAAHHRCLLPRDVLQRHDLKPESLYSRRSANDIAAAVRDVAEAFVPGVRPDTPVLKASQSLAGMYVGQIRRLKGDVFSPRMGAPPAFKALRLIASAGLRR